MMMELAVGHTEWSSEEKMEKLHVEIDETIASPRQVQTVAGVRKSVSPREFLDLHHSRNPEEGTTLHQIPKPPITPERSPVADRSCSSCTVSQRKRSAMKAQEWDLGTNVNGAADVHRIGTRRCMLFEQEADASSATSQRSKSSIDEGVWVSDCERRSWWSNSPLVRCAKNSCSRISSIAEAVLRLSLCVVIAVPVTMVFVHAVKMLQTPEAYFLVPT